jgi:plasmid stabilization system protein ParE
VTTYTIRWLPRSLQNYRRVIEYLKKEWGQKTINGFIDKTEANLLLLQQGTMTGVRLQKDTSIHRILITKHNYLIYRIRPRKSEIELLAFWDTRQDPKKANFD